MTADGLGDGGEQLAETELEDRPGRSAAWRAGRPARGPGTRSAGASSPAIAVVVVVLDQLTKAWLVVVRRVRARSRASSATACASCSATTPAACSASSATRRSCSGSSRSGVVGADRGLPRAVRAEPLPLDHARPAARRRDRQPDRPVPARLRRRLGRHRDRRLSGSRPSTWPTRPSAPRSSCSSAWRCSRRLAARRRCRAGCLRRRDRRRAADAARARRARRSGGPVRRRRDRPVAELRPEAHHRRPPDRGRRRRSGRTRSSPPGAELRLDVPPPAALDLAPAPDIPVDVVYEDDDLLIVDKPSGWSSIRRRGTRPARSSTPCWRAPAGGVRRDRRRRAAGHRAPARPRHQRPAHGGQARCRPGLADGPAQGAAGQEDLPRAGPGHVSAAASAGSRRPIGRDPRAPDADGRRARRAAVGDGLPRPRAVRRLDAPGAGPRSPAGPTRSASTSTPSAIRSRATRSTGRALAVAGPTGLDRLFLHAWRLELEFAVRRAA